MNPPVSGASDTAHLTATETLSTLLLEQARADHRNGLNTGGMVTGYPGSPVGGVQGEMERRSDELAAMGIVQSAGLNEELAATVLWGTQTLEAAGEAKVDGVFGMWYGKAPGIDRAADALRHGNLRGAAKNGGVLVVAGDDPNANATVFPTDSIGAFYAWGMPVLSPGTVQEILDLGRHGYALSRLCSLWVGLKLVTTVADGSGSVDLNPGRIAPILPTVEMDGQPFEARIRPLAAGAMMREAERDLFLGRLKLAAEYIRVNELNPIVANSALATTGIVAVGKVFYDLRQALLRMNISFEELARLGVRVKHIRAVNPIGQSEWEEFADGLSEVVVIEEKRPFVENSLLEALYSRADHPRVFGKKDEDGNELFPIHGELNASRVAKVLRSRFATAWQLDGRAKETQPLLTRPPLPLATARTPYFCSGCPHNSSLLTPEGAKVGAGIGCHLMNLMVPREEYGETTGYTQMGGEGAQWVGMAPFTKTEHIFQNVGDGTFHHSASLAMRLAVAAGVNITYKLLYNSAVGMTGGQRVRGAMSVPDLTRLMRAEGVGRIIVTTEDTKRYRRKKLAPNVQVWHRDRLIEAQELLAKETGVTALIHDQVCAAEKRRMIRRREIPKPTKRIVINERVCEGCGDCNDKSQCLSVQPLETEFGRKTKIEQSSCNFDYTCVKGDCPSFMTVDVSKATKKKTEVPLAPTSPEPGVTWTESFAVHMTGIGGSGVISVNRTLAKAANLDGLLARCFDLPGASIKAGPVVSQLQVYPKSAVSPASAIEDGQADLYLGFDLLGAMRQDNLAPLSPENSVAVASSSAIPTGQMAYDPTLPYRDTEALQAEVNAVTKPGRNVFLDLNALASGIFGDQMAGNMMLVGAAFQAGVLPISAESIEAAIVEEGVAADQNIAAFRWGRAAISDPTSVAKFTKPVDANRQKQSDAMRAMLVGLDDIAVRERPVAYFAEDLADFQNLKYARRYVDAVRRVRDIDVRADRQLTSAIAAGLHKVMAYKDEYEVARLHLLDSSKLAIKEQFGSGAKVSWNLHPPVFRYLGLKNKISLGPWFKPGFTALRAMRRLRGTPLDPFGFARVRRVERALADHYLRLVDQLVDNLDETNYDSFVGLMNSAESIRGYEFIKLRRVREYVGVVESRAKTMGLDPCIDRVRRLLPKKEGEFNE